MKKRLKFLTCREYVAIHKPAAIYNDYGGVYGCPHQYGLRDNCGHGCYNCYNKYARNRNNKYIAVIKE
jgi:hypothetical protein